ncbi:MAG: epoxyqueuosine reductase [Acidobacteria bacterium]|nr:epoxyqueuosine reductase [Acidobacteriota bacterium]
MTEPRIRSDTVKTLAAGLGAEACGIASVERFDGAPAGFHPTEVWPDCRSVVVFLKSMPAEVLLAGLPVPYTHAASLMYAELDRLGLDLCRALEARGVRALPVPCDTPYVHWEPERSHGMGVLSMRHAARLAGLGILGRNTLLIHPTFGNRVYIGAVLMAENLEADPLVDDFRCPARCRKCLEACEPKALDGVTVDQSRCRAHSFARVGRGFDLYRCCECRRACPLREGRPRKRDAPHRREG